MPTDGYEKRRLNGMCRGNRYLHVMDTYILVSMGMTCLGWRLDEILGSVRETINE